MNCSRTVRQMQMHEEPTAVLKANSSEKNQIAKTMSAV